MKSSTTHISLRLISLRLFAALGTLTSSGCKDAVKQPAEANEELYHIDKNTSAKFRRHVKDFVDRMASAPAAERREIVRSLLEKSGNPSRDPDWENLRSFLTGVWAIRVQLGEETPESLSDFVRLIEALAEDLDLNRDPSSPYRVLVYTASGIPPATDDKAAFLTRFRAFIGRTPRMR